MRFEEAGKPARPPIYRDGDHYSLDPHDDETDLWAFRLGLRPARAVPLHVVQPDSGPSRTPDPAALKANQQRLERERHAHGEELARMRRVLDHAFPVGRPEAVVLVDMAERTITTFIGQEISFKQDLQEALRSVGLTVPLPSA